LTSAEARLLREGNWEARAICYRPVLKGVLSAVPPVLLLAAAASYFSGGSGAARVLPAAGMMMGVLLEGLFLPLYTPARSRVFRCVKWVVFAGALALAFGPDLVVLRAGIESDLHIPPPIIIDSGDIRDGSRVGFGRVGSQPVGAL
jgi:hypothetical protein